MSQNSKGEHEYLVSGLQRIRWCQTCYKGVFRYTVLRKNSKHHPEAAFPARKNCGIAWDLWEGKSVGFFSDAEKNRGQTSSRADDGRREYCKVFPNVEGGGLTRKEEDNVLFIVFVRPFGF